MRLTSQRIDWRDYKCSHSKLEGRMDHYHQLGLAALTTRKPLEVVRIHPEMAESDESGGLDRRRSR